MNRNTNRRIGGFLPIETPAGDGPYHTDLHELSFGRGCLATILRQVRPRKVHVPFYICESILEPIRANGAEACFYAIDHNLLPAVEMDVASDEVVLLVNYFGIRAAALQPFVERWRSRCIIDNTHAFFERPIAGTWMFNSARKFFGVPDGAYLHAPVGVDLSLLPQFAPRRIHLYWQRSGHPRAFDAFLKSESAIDSEPRKMSRFSQSLLGSLDYRHALATRRQNSLHLHRFLGKLNLLADPVTVGASALCYPLLLGSELSRADLTRSGLHIPTFWKEVVDREGGGFEWERHLASALLPLPIDHRYGPNEMDELVTRLEAAIRWAK